MKIVGIIREDNKPTRLVLEDGAREEYVAVHERGRRVHLNDTITSVSITSITHANTHVYDRAPFNASGTNPRRLQH
jgi:hypothetical protein